MDEAEINMPKPEDIPIWQEAARRSGCPEEIVQQMAALEFWMPRDAIESRFMEEETKSSLNLEDAANLLEQIQAKE